jgi:RimJ/RimL family protein N-acetyltransferase
MDIRPVVLEGQVVRLVPLTRDHQSALCAVGLDPELWRWTTNVVTTSQQMTAYIDAALDAQAQGSALPFATCLVDSARVVGSTRFGNIDQANRRVEIGWTWIGRAWQRAAVNTEAKYLMLRHAFEHWGCLRVELKTDALNQTSRRAILRLGAKEEGVLRKHMVTDTGRIRDTVYFSILDTEWPDVRDRLQAMLAQRTRPRSGSA